MEDSMALVFMYGSNINSEHLNVWIQDWQGRNTGRTCKVVSSVVARLPGYRLCWNYRRNDGTGAANIALDSESEVWGVVRELSDLNAIDQKEGFRANNLGASDYLRIEEHVALESGIFVPTFVYVARDTESIFVSPARKYKELLLDGALEFNLPDSYVETIKSVQNREEEIESTAYFRWLDFGSMHGNDWEDWFEAEELLAATLRKCVYCLKSKRFYTKTVKGKNEFNVEHVVHQAFGKCKNNNPTLVGRVCIDCNHEFSRTIDIAATKDSYEAFLRAQHGLKDPEDLSGRDSRRLSVKYTSEGGSTGTLPVEPAPQGSSSGALVASTIIRLHKKDGKGLEILDTKQVAKLSKEELLTRFDFSKEMNFTGSEEAIGILRELLEEKMQTKAREIEGSPILSSRQEIIVDEILQRAFSKIAFNYFVYVCEDRYQNLPYRSEFDDARNSIRHGIEPAWGRIANPWLNNLSSIHSMFNNIGHLVMLEFGTNERDDICLIGKVVLFNGYGYRIALSPKCEYNKDIEKAHFWDLTTNQLIAVDSGLHDKLRGM